MNAGRNNTILNLIELHFFTRKEKDGCAVCVFFFLPFYFIYDKKKMDKLKWPQIKPSLSGMFRCIILLVYDQQKLQVPEDKYYDLS